MAVLERCHNEGGGVSNGQWVVVNEQSMKLSTQLLPRARAAPTEMTGVKVPHSFNNNQAVASG
jgi:hypothetical protein